MGEKDIRELIVERVLWVYPAAEKIVLFGSQANGGAMPESDYDLLVVADSELQPARRAARLYMVLRDLGFPFDIIVATPEEYARNIGWRSTVIHAAATTGRLLYEAA